MSKKNKDNNIKDNSAQVTLYLLDNGAIDCQVEWFFPHDSSASDVEIDTMITLIHGLSGYMHTRFYEVFQMGKAIEAGLQIKEQMLSKDLFPDDPQTEMIFTPDEDLAEWIDEENSNKKSNGKTGNIVDMKEFISTKKDPKKYH